MEDLYDQRINEHDQQYEHKNGKTNHKFTGVKNLFKGMFHVSISPLFRLRRFNARVNEAV